jgi:cell fate (sporulation/competence/biofilm development) regulator YmcA (YheA/YmcA/DUF963 family)
MDESNCVVHAHIRKPDDYQIVNDTPYANSFVIKTELGDVILTIDFKIALMMAMDLVKAVAARIKQDVNKEMTDISALEN